VSKPKKSLPTIQEHVMGMIKKDKFDSLQICNDPRTPFYMDNAKFTQTFCRRCRNEECIRAGGAQTPWHWRMENQPEYLLNNPIFSDMGTDEHKRLAEMAFKLINDKMQRIEIQSQTWEPLDQIDLPSDGIDRVSSPAVTDEFDEAAKVLSKAKGKKVKEFPKPQESTQEKPANFIEAPPDVSTPSEDNNPPEEESDEGVLFETPFVSKDGKTTYRVWLDKDSYWHCTCEGFKHKGTCYHVVETDAWLKKQSQEAEEREREAERVRNLPPPPQPKPVNPSTLNTPPPTAGVMIGGGTPPPTASRLPPARVIPAVDDPWSAPKEKVVKPGAKIIVGKKDD
jgi:hypothetical protein